MKIMLIDCSNSSEQDSVQEIKALSAAEIQNIENIWKVANAKQNIATLSVEQRLAELEAQAAALRAELSSL